MFRSLPLVLAKIGAGDNKESLLRSSNSHQDSSIEKTPTPHHRRNGCLPLHTFTVAERQPPSPESAFIIKVCSQNKNCLFKAPWMQNRNNWKLESQGKLPKCDQEPFTHVETMTPHVLMTLFLLTGAQNWFSFFCPLFFSITTQHNNVNYGLS